VHPIGVADFVTAQMVESSVDNGLGRGGVKRGFCIRIEAGAADVVRPDPKNDNSMGSAFTAAAFGKVQIKGLGRRISREVRRRLSAAAAADIHDGTTFAVLEKRKEAASHVNDGTAVDLDHISYVGHLAEGEFNRNKLATLSLIQQNQIAA